MDIIKENFKLYNKIDEYTVLCDDGQKRPASITITKKDEDVIIKNDNKGIGVYRKKFIDVLSPDKIDSRMFWKEATSKFPLVSISGCDPNIKTIAEANLATFNFARLLGALDVVKEFFDLDKKTRILEIGPGFGGFQERLAYNYSDENYYAIDVNPLFNHPRLFETDGKTIPNNIPDSMDIVYSINVFQHLSKNQRTAYYKQAYDILKRKGVFIVGSFVETTKNKSWPVWGCKDYRGNNYINFFRQFTPVDNEIELIYELSDLGFDVKPISTIADKCNYLSYKCTKV